ncbi:MAG: glycoside hydrolase family 30 protein [Eubacteriales bacterium]|nr:glycoside hydrolase family 30 protein [Eubacteriales bacterium]
MKGKIRVFITDYNSHAFLQEKEPLFFHADREGYRANEANIFNIYDEVRYQEILGFGGAMTQASAVNLMKMSAAGQEAVMKGYFDREEGIGYSLCRTTINSCDFSTEFYTCDDTENDWELKDFSLEHDRQDVIPMIKKALSINQELKLFASPWSPPGWMKTNGRMDKGRYLRKDCRQVWADYFVKFLQEYEREGIPVWGITIQNETHAEMGWESCYYTAQDEREFAGEYLRPALCRAGLGDKKVLCWDHNKERAFDRASEIFSDKKAGEAVDGIAIHWYAGDHFGALDAIHQMYPGKLILGTEACMSNEPRECYAAGEKYAHDMIGDLNHWACGWVDWNMLLDTTGRPDHWMDEQLAFRERFLAGGCRQEELSETEKEFLLPCISTGIWVGEAPMVVDHETEKIRFSSSYYYIGHFSKFIRPGAVRIGNSMYTHLLEGCTFENPDGGKVAVVMNPGDRTEKLTLRYRDEIAETSLPAHSIVTCLFK